jgi:hypothetical protein
MRWAGIVALVREMRSAYEVSGEKPEEKRPVEIRRRRHEMILKCVRIGTSGGSL